MAGADDGEQFAADALHGRREWGGISIVGVLDVQPALVAADDPGPVVGGMGPNVDVRRARAPGTVAVVNPEVRAESPGTPAEFVMVEVVDAGHGAETGPLAGIRAEGVVVADRVVGRRAQALHGEPAGEILHGRELPPHVELVALVVVGPHLGGGFGHTHLRLREDGLQHGLELRPRVCIVRI